MIITIPKWDVIQLSEHFWSYEFRCRCRYQGCNHTYYDTDLIAYLERKRKELGGKPFIITSGYRCAQYNLRKKGKAGSLHLVGKAADFYVPNENMIKLASHFEDADGLGKYPKRNFIHVDVRGYKSRWVYLQGGSNE